MAQTLEEFVLQANILKSLPFHPILSMTTVVSTVFTIYYNHINPWKYLNCQSQRSSCKVLSVQGYCLSKTDYMSVTSILGYKIEYMVWYGVLDLNGN